jgi:hypothetical protein
MISKKGIDTELKILYTKMTLKWCKENLGINSKKRKKLILDISYKNRKKGKIIYYGNYCFNGNKLTIYVGNCETLHDIISTVIHEYTHYLQSSKLYREYAKMYYYSHNPCERQAKRNEVKHTKTCFKEIKKLIKSPQ